MSDITNDDKINLKCYQSLRNLTLHPRQRSLLPLPLQRSAPPASSPAAPPSPQPNPEDVVHDADQEAQTKANDEPHLGNGTFNGNHYQGVVNSIVRDRGTMTNYYLYYNGVGDRSGNTLTSASGPIGQSYTGVVQKRDLDNIVIVKDNYSQVDYVCANIYNGGLAEVQDFSPVSIAQLLTGPRAGTFVILSVLGGHPRSFLASD